MAFRLGFFVLLLVTAVTAGAETLDGRIDRVVDGDTLMVLDGSNRQRAIRLLGIDAPELTQEFGQKALSGLSRLTAGQPVTAECHRLGPTDLCRVRIGGKDIALELVREGMAWWNPQHAGLQTNEERADYQQAEFNAKIHRLGLWNSKNPVPPWQWRLP